MFEAETETETEMKTQAVGQWRKRDNNSVSPTFEKVWRQKDNIKVGIASVTEGLNILEKKTLELISLIADRQINILKCLNLLQDI